MSIGSYEENTRKNKKIIDKLPSKGNLVKRKDKGEIGIVITVGVAQGKALVFFGDGLTMEVELDNLERMLFSPNAKIVANFIELVNAYEQVTGRRTTYPW